MKLVAITDSAGRFSFSGEKTLQLVVIASDPVPHWELCIEYEDRVFPGFRPYGFGLPKKVHLQCNVDKANPSVWDGICG